MYASARRMGVGKALMERVNQWAKERELESVQLTVWDFNQGAIEFYKALGYDTVRLTMACKL